MPNLLTAWKQDHRNRTLIAGEPAESGRCVVYWMQRAQRGRGNPALNLAIEAANALKLPVFVVFVVKDNDPNANRRHDRFMLDALPEIREDLERKNIEFIVRLGRPDEVVLQLCAEETPALLVGDENPLRVERALRDKVARNLKHPFILVDADVVVPASLFPKEEYAARTIRPKIHRVLHEYLKPIPEPKSRFPRNSDETPRGVTDNICSIIDLVRVGGASDIPAFRGGPREAANRLRRFTKDRLNDFAEKRNEPSRYVTSELSAHLRFGHIGPIEVALAVQSSGANAASIDALIEELIVRRELAVNFVARNPNYDTLAGCPSWALKTLAKHSDDRRPYLYSIERLDACETHDPIWNAAQCEMILTGRMHGYMRMYWAKKILEWTPDAATAFGIALELNDTYEMDGRDPNGYAGVAWSIGGKHDRPWPERPVFGTVRYMSGENIKRKIDARGYLERIGELNGDSLTRGDSSELRSPPVD